MDQVKVSIIVPVYNTEKYLDQCLASLVRQTLSEIEILVINDGSPDNSQKIIDRYVQCYPQKVIGYVKENGGLGDARNYGIEIAKGEYIGFVDSDDWVDRDMFRLMYDKAEKDNCDIVICDFIEVKDGRKIGSVSYGYRGELRDGIIEQYDFVLNSLNPATACNKLYRRTLFNIKKFPLQWYEDMATTPVLLSYAHKIGYFPAGLYFYRQGKSTITKAEADPRTLQVIDSWSACLDEVNPRFLKAMEAAVYSSICVFTHFKEKFRQEILEYAVKNKKTFLENEIIRRWIKEKQIEDLFADQSIIKSNITDGKSHKAQQMIPKIIHYFWFGENQKSELIQGCIESWRKNAPDFEIIEWNESNCDIHVNTYVEEAYMAQKWAFVADYFRMEKIEEFGGLYLDTDTQLMKNPSVLLSDPAFFAFETRDAVHAGIFGAVPHHPIIVACKKTYNDSSFRSKDGTYHTAYTVVRRVTEQLQELGLLLNGKEQFLLDGTHIYPANKLTLDMYDGESIAQHHYDCSWWEAQEKASYKNTVLRDWFLCESGPTELSDLARERDHYKKECEQLKRSTSWRITKPLRWLMGIVRKIYRKIKRYRICSS